MEERSGRVGFGGGGFKCDLLNSLGGQRGVWCLTSLTDTPLLLQLELVFKLLMSVERRNTEVVSKQKSKRNGGKERLREGEFKGVCCVFTFKESL